MSFYSQYSSILDKLILSIETGDLGTATNYISRDVMMMALDDDIIIYLQSVWTVTMNITVDII